LNNSVSGGETPGETREKSGPGVIFWPISIQFGFNSAGKSWFLESDR